MDRTFEDAYTRGCERMSVQEAAYRLGCGTDKIYAIIRKGCSWGEFIPPPKGKSNGDWIIRRQAFENWLKGGETPISQTIIIDTPEAFNALCKVAIDRVVTGRASI